MISGDANINTFTNEYGYSYQQVEFKNKLITIEEEIPLTINKESFDGEILTGAKFTLEREDGETWEIDDEEITLYSGTHTLTETSAPIGYEIAEPITFFLGSD